MPIHNADIAAVFTEIADLLELEDANPFRVRAYRNAARVVGEAGHDLRAMVAAGEDLKSLPGIGQDLAGKIREVVETGKCGLLVRLRQEVPSAIAELLRIPGLGPKRVRTLWHDLGIETPNQLRQAAREGRIQTLSGFGEKTEAKILEAVEAHLRKDKRVKRAAAEQHVEALVAHLGAVAGVERVAVAGSYRRQRDTVGDLDVLVAAGADSPAVAAFTRYDEVGDILASGPTRASVRLRSGLQVDLRVVPAECYGAALCYFTGSKAHGIALRGLAQEHGLKINEYGVFREEERIAGDTEESVYRAVGLPYIEPELREDRGEIEAAKTDRLPRLIEVADLKGDLHCHTWATDGRDSLRQMAQAAAAGGHEYLAITDHTRHVVPSGLDADGLARQIDDIDRLNAELSGFRILKGIEVDILEDGTLDMPDPMLARLDVVVAAVHSHFDLSRDKQTERILRAMDNRYFNILAHPTGRLIGKRETADLDMPRLIRHAKSRACFMELDSQPDRLDLTDTWCMAAKAEGVLVSIDSDAHKTEDLGNVRLGIGQARRGWLEAADVLNTRPLDELRRLLRR